MISRHLIVKFYLWFLLALTLTVTSTAGVIVHISSNDSNGKSGNRILSDVRLGRDVAQNLLHSGLSLEAARQVLAPMAEGDHMSLAIVGADGRALLAIVPRGEGWEDALPGKALVRETLADGGAVVREGGLIGAALPIALPGGERGVFFVAVRRWFPGAEGTPYRLLAGLGVLLVVGWLLCWPLASHLARPLKRMSAAADALGRGDLTARIDIRRRDEIGRLANSFNAMAENLHKLIDGHKQLLADISHELRSPLARLKVALELGRRDAGENGISYLDQVERQANDIDGLIEEMLVYSRLDATPYALRLEPLAPRAVLEEVAEANGNEARARRLVLALPEGVDAPPVSVDRILLLRALGNVLRNAIAYAPEGSTIHLDASAECGRLTFSIRDGGPGVPAAMRERIFEPFFRTDAARVRATGGVGLGLAIARRCMEAHGGGAVAESPAEGTGLAIRLWLPLP